MSALRCCYGRSGFCFLGGGLLISLMIQVIQTSQRYVSGVRNASKNIVHSRSCDSVLEDLQASSNDIGNSHNIDSSVLNACSDDLEQLWSKLCKQTNSNSKTSHLNRLTWPFAEDETRKLTEVLHRYQSSLHVAISTQSYRLSAATLVAIENVSDRQERDVRERIVRLISVADPLVNHNAARDKREEQTGDWLLRSVEFAEWIQNPSQNLWIRSIPGADPKALPRTFLLSEDVFEQFQSDLHLILSQEDWVHAWGELSERGSAVISHQTCCTG